MSDTTSNTIHVSLGVIYRFSDDGKAEIFMQVRDEQGPLFGKWEFPGGNIESGETPEQAIVREIHEEVGIQIKPVDVYYLKTYEVEVPGKKIRLYTHIVNTEKRSELSTWFDLNYEFSNIPPKNYEIIEDLKRFFDTRENFAKLETLLWKR